MQVLVAQQTDDAIATRETASPWVAHKATFIPFGSRACIIGATGHSQGAMATSQAAGDSHITTCVPIEGAMVQKNLHGPAMLFCGGQDTIVGCSGAQSALNAITTLPAMYAEYLSADHGSWMSYRGDKLSDVDTANVAWMRVHLMGDTELRPWFYGESCKLCTDVAWKIDRKNMDQ